MEDKLKIIEEFVRHFIKDDVILVKRYNQILLQIGDRFLDFTVDEEDIEDSVIANAEKGIGWNFDRIF